MPREEGCQSDYRSANCCFDTAGRPAAEDWQHIGEHGETYASDADQHDAARIGEDLSVGLIYPPQSRILQASLHVAERLASYIFDHGLARVPRPGDVGALIRNRAYRPAYAT